MLLLPDCLFCIKTKPFEAGKSRHRHVADADKVAIANMTRNATFYRNNATILPSRTIVIPLHCWGIKTASRSIISFPCWFQFHKQISLWYIMPFYYQNKKLYLWFVINVTFFWHYEQQNQFDPICQLKCFHIFYLLVSWENVQRKPLESWIYSSAFV